MLRAIKKQFAIQWRDWVLGYLCVLVVSMLGVLMANVVMQFGQEAESYVSLGAIMGCGMAVVYSGLWTMMQLGICFNQEISMGYTRSRFFVSFYTVNFVGNFLMVLLLLLIGLGENQLYHVLYPGGENEINLIPYLFRVGLPAAFALSMAAGLCGVLLMRYGRKAFWALWGLWMFGFLGIPYISDAVKDAPDSFLGMVGNAFTQWLKAVPGNVWIILAAVFSLLSFGITFLFIKKQQVTA